MEKTTDNPTKEYMVLKKDPHKYDEIFKVILIGDPAVGKTCLISRAIHGVFLENYDVTLSGQSSTFLCKVSSKVVKLSVWDTGGQEIHRSITKIFYKGSDCAILVYDLTKRETFKHLLEWLAEVRQCVKVNAKFCLIGNKQDKQLEKDKIFEKQVLEWAKSENIDIVIDTSAKTGENVDELFKKIAFMLYENKEIAEKTKNIVLVDKNVNCKKDNCHC